ncbi:hypothetical protein COLO4_25904 [Corchorus olitorius]|uniref:Uncharacterized protein n=1 Tax=Corchorus olitorius TaxID=93759 RepID=A0A1R3HZG5_9ROSI|nr:hypothetical protein COLO4_25904 [Corchorus olitorius]
MSCLCVPEGEFDELLEHVPLSTRRKSLLSSTLVFQNQDESSNAPVCGVIICKALGRK